MTNPPYNRFQILIRNFATTRLGAWFFAHTAQVLDRMFLKLNRGQRTLASIVAGLPMMVMTTRGAKSGLLRTTPLTFIQDEPGSDQIAVIASNLGQHRISGWYYNLKAHPQATCSFEGRTCAYLAHEAGGEEYDRFWQAAVRTFAGYETYRVRAGRRIPIMVLVPQQARPPEVSDQRSEFGDRNQQSSSLPADEAAPE